jgi:hypothetical protein
MSDVHEFDPRNYAEQRRKRLARIANAAVEPPWPASEKIVPIKAAPPVAPPVAPEPPKRVIVAKVSRSYQPWFSIEDAEPVVFKPTVREVQVVVGAYYRISTMDIRSARRTQNIVRPRQIAMYLARKLTSKTMPEIGRYFGGRDHTTVLHAVRKMEALLETNPILAGEVAELTRRLSGEVTNEI